METTTLVLLIIGIAVVGLAIWIVSQRTKIKNLRTRYGPEYERLAEQQKDPLKVAAILRTREKRVSNYNIRTLTPEECDLVSQDWRAVQEHFVDSPHDAVLQADALVSRALQARGYPMSDFEQQADDLSVEHPHMVDNYRAAHAIARRGQSATTEDLRRAMQHYRNLLENIIDAHVLQTGRHTS